ncbi:hypothetical protein [Burkholderia glumae]|uniref:hypothetical protein n=1 Tax=Burkholderia glumae TaxID=337 RepID=UPI002150B352|nr:hypothetical protein [Burkholderia glumae]
MTVASDVQDVTYTTDGSTVNFPIPFYFLADAHIDASLIAADGAATELFVGSDFTLSGAGDPDGGTLTTLTVRPAGLKLRIFRNVPVTQETQYQQNDAFPAKTTEKALDKLTMIDQQHAASIGRALQVPITDIAPNTLLPKATDRANKALGFDSIGNPLAIALLISSVMAPVVDSIDMLRLVSKADAQTVFATGYWLPCDGGGGVYRQNHTIPPGTAVDNGGSRIVAADGGVWDLQVINSVSIMQFGARRGDVADGIDVADNTARIQACFDNALVWEVPDGRFVHGDLTIPQKVGHVLYGSGPGSTLVQIGGGIHYPAMANNVFDSKGTIRDLTFEGTHGTANTLDTSYCQTLNIERLLFNDTPVGLTSLKLDGNPVAGVYAHDVRVDDVRIYSQTAGNAGIALGSWHSDSFIHNFWMNGFFQVNYCVLALVNAQTTYFSDCHPYNAKINIVRLNGNNGNFRWSDCTFDYALQDTFYMLNSVNNQFNMCFFQATTPGNRALVFDGSYNNNLTNVQFQAPYGVALTCFQEINGSSGNKVDIWQVDDPAHWASIANFNGDGTWLTGNQNYGKYGTIQMLRTTARTAQAQGTIIEYGANGGGGFLNEAWATLEGYSLNVLATVDNAPPAGETMTFNLRKNGAAIAGGVITAGQKSVRFAASPQNFHNAGDRVSIQSVFSAGSGSASPAITVQMIV